ncbi:pirin-like protein isoform X2 [Cryptomeria japonica]|uniref:pirin-like protein isoform X2 n=1 Tax=Cryptomeria japonica TaxID=3369 RepID=UPI0025AD25AB|nr:pirin-like protein isoform X2 [Cryptomeria japonica]
MSDMTPFVTPRVVAKQVLSREQYEGEGAIVRRSIGRPELKSLDPFLLLDEFSGFETVTYMLEGAFTHEDFVGHKGTIKAGDLQWMTAGRGIVHSEMPAGEGLQHGLQLWVNLAAKDKMIEPKYQELEGKDIPKVEKDGVKATVIAGEALGIESRVYTRTPTMYLDFKMEAQAVLHQPIPEGWNAFVYVLEGEASFGTPNSPPVGAHHTLVLSSGDGVSVWNNKPCRFVVIGGQPLNEPVVQHGPFVMNTRQEIVQTIQDYHLGRNGFERANVWHSQIA